MKEPQKKDMKYKYRKDDRLMRLSTWAMNRIVEE